MFDRVKTENAIVYIIKNRGMAGAFNVLALADLLHANKYGRTISGDTWLISNDGTKPICIRDTLCEDGCFQLLLTNAFDGVLEIDFDEFSTSDLQALDKAIAIHSQYVLNLEDRVPTS